jgi:D-amino-acid dehydrogenase
MSADGLPFIGKTRLDGLYINSGQGHLGWTLAMGSANLLADQIQGKESAIDIKPYLASRSL